VFALRVCAIVGEKSGELYGAVPALWHQSENRLQVAGPIPSTRKRRSRRSFASSQEKSGQLAEAKEQALVSLRSTYPSWGARKIRRLLKNQGEKTLPA